MRWSGVLASAVAVGFLAVLSCSHSGVKLVGPDRCEGLSKKEAQAIEYLLDVLAAYDQHCREDDALMGR